MWMPLGGRDKKLVDMQIAGPSIKTRTVQYQVSFFFVCSFDAVKECVDLKDTIPLGWI